MSSKKTIVLISGGNTGIGLATATELSQEPGYHVIIGSRDATAGEKAAADLVAHGGSASSVQLDITSSGSITSAVTKIEHEHGVIDVLINNAAIMLDYVPGAGEARKNLSIRDLFTQTLAVNVIGTACLTDECLPLLHKSSFPRLLFVSSRMGSLAEANKKSNPWYPVDYKAYDVSKAAVNMLALNYVRILDGTGAVVNLVCPGLVKTKLTLHHEHGATTVEGAKRIVELAMAPKGSPSATFTDRNGEIPW